MKISRTVFALAAFLLLVSSAGYSQQNDLSAQLKGIIGVNGNGYLEPFASALGAGLNSGLYHSADLHSVLGFDIGVKVGLAMISSGHKTFDFVLPNQLIYQDNPTTTFTLHANTDYDPIVKNSPTFAGPKTGQPVYLKPSSAYYLFLVGRPVFVTPAGFDRSSFPMFAPQAAIGLPFGIEVIGRFLPSTSIGDAGKVNFAGIGLRYDIDQYIPFCPVDIAVHFMTQKATVDDKNGNKVMSLSGTAFGAEVSKSLIILTLYGGFQIESSKLTVDSYTPDPIFGQTTTISGFTVNGSDKARGLVGIRFLLAVINIHADYSFSKYPVATAGVGITFR